jgi:uncharacterized membrane protein YqgA involved in biofilm formation
MADRPLPLRGTLLNTVTVAAGAALGLLAGAGLPQALLGTALAGLGLVTIGIGVKMFLDGRNALVVAAAMGIGGALGAALGISDGLDLAAEWARRTLGAGGRFNEALITTSVLFCVGPMTLLGCLEDGLERKIDLLALKSTLDGIASFFFAATLGPGVLVTALVVLVFQGGLTLAAGSLRGLRDHPEALGDLTAAGGCLMIAIGLGLAEVKRLPTANFLPALLLAPLFTALARRATL